MQNLYEETLKHSRKNPQSKREQMKRHSMFLDREDWSLQLVWEDRRSRSGRGWMRTWSCWDWPPERGPICVRETSMEDHGEVSVKAVNLQVFHICRWATARIWRKEKYRGQKLGHSNIYRFARSGDLLQKTVRVVTRNKSHERDTLEAKDNKSIREGTSSCMRLAHCKNSENVLNE